MADIIQWNKSSLKSSKKIFKPVQEIRKDWPCAALRQQYPILEYLLESCLFHLQSTFLLTQWEDIGRWSKQFGLPQTLMVDQDGVPDFWLWPGPAQVEVVWLSVSNSANRRFSFSLLLSLLLSFPVKQTNNPSYGTREREREILRSRGLRFDVVTRCFLPGLWFLNASIVCL